MRQRYSIGVDKSNSEGGDDTHFFKNVALLPQKEQNIFFECIVSVYNRTVLGRQFEGV